MSKQILIYPIFMVLYCVILLNIESGGMQIIFKHKKYRFLDLCKRVL